MDRKFGRLIVKDARDTAYPMRLALVPPTAATRYWRTGPILDQGQLPECVAFATEEWLEASPTRTMSGPTPDAIYAAAQQVDGIAGPHDGTTVRAALKVMQAEGRIANYLWAENVMDVVNWLLTRGGVILGTNWYEGQMVTDRNGFVNITGSVVGGHGYFACGYSVTKRAVRCLQSWGPTWGQGGRFWLRFADLVRLLSEDGEAAGMVEKRP